jgi:hypothetical protein
MQLKILDMPDDVIEQYKLNNIVTPDGHIYSEIQKGMYGLPQAGIITQELLADRLRQHGYMQSKTMPGLWLHEMCPIQFSLVVNDFGVCVCACPPVMRGYNVKHALTSTSSPPNDIRSIPWSPVVLPLWTPWGAC